MGFFRKLLKNITNKKQQNEQKIQVKKDRKLLYPYLCKKTIDDHPNLDEYNLARLYSIENYLNQKKKTKENDHPTLERFYRQDKLFNWVGIAADIRFENKRSGGRLLLERVALDNPEHPVFIDDHLWLKLNDVKAVLTDQQTIGSGDAVRGVSKIDSYIGKEQQDKFGLRKTVIKNAGIYVGKKIRNPHQTNLHCKIVSNYDRKKDWVAKISNKENVSNLINKKIDINELLQQKGHVEYRLKGNTHRHIIPQAVDLPTKTKSKKKANDSVNQIKQNAQKLLVKKKNHIVVQGTITRYTGKIGQIRYYRDQQDVLQLAIQVQNIRDELNIKIASRSYFAFSDKVIALGEINPNDQIAFSTRSILPNNMSTIGKFETIKFVKNTEKRLPLPKEHDALIGYFMTVNREGKEENVPYLQAYRDWAIKNNLPDPQSMEEKLHGFLNKTDIAFKLKIDIKTLNKFLYDLRIKPSLKYQGKTYYSNKVIDKLRPKVATEEMIANARKDSPLSSSSVIPYSPLADEYDLVLVTKKAIYYTNTFKGKGLTKVEEHLDITGQYKEDFYIKCVDGSHTEHFIKVKDIKEIGRDNHVREILINNQNQ